MLRNKANHTFIASWHFLIIILSFSFLIELGGYEIKELLRYQSDSLSAQEYWRLLTGHLTHLGWSHFFLNAIGFVLIWSLFKSVFSTMRWSIIFLLCSLGTSLCFYFFDKHLDWYVGLSGVLHGLIMASLIMSIFLSFRVNNKLIQADVILLIIIIVKLTYEQIVGAIPMTEASSGGMVIVNAHFYGAIIGTICASFYIIKDKSLSTIEAQT